MSDDKKPSILQQVTGELKESKRKAVKGELKGLLEDLEKANAVRAGVIDKIVDKLESVGENADDVRAMLEG